MNGTATATASPATTPRTGHATTAPRTEYYLAQPGTPHTPHTVYRHATAAGALRERDCCDRMRALAGVTGSSPLTVVMAVTTYTVIDMPAMPDNKEN